MPHLPQIGLLDDLEKIQQQDPENVYGSIQALADQVADTWDKVKNLPSQQGKLLQQIDPKQVQNIVVAGMGGSALGPHVIQKAFQKELSVPFEIINNYYLPHYVNKHTLVIASSYSGNTEEIVSAAQEALQKKSQLLIITTGGQLLELAQKNQLAHFIIDPQHNPSNQPRMALGYSIFAVIALLNKLKMLSLSDQVVNNVIATIRRRSQEMEQSVPAQKNQAKQLAFQILTRIPVFVAAEHLEGSVHVLQNQFNENSKSYAEYRIIPELNHHLMEGLRFPQTNDQNLYFIHFTSELYHPRTQIRFEITQQVIDGADIEQVVYQLQAKTILEQVFEVITFGSYANFYLAMLHQENPATIETVDFFKAELNKKNG